MGMEIIKSLLESFNVSSHQGQTTVEIVPCPLFRDTATLKPHNIPFDPIKFTTDVVKPLGEGTEAFTLFPDNLSLRSCRHLQRSPCC